MSPYRKIALIVSSALALLGISLAAPYIGLGVKEQFVLYQGIHLSRGDAIAYVEVVAALFLFYPVATVLASFLPARALSLNPAGMRRESRRYRPEIDGLRAVAVTAVIINHFHDSALPGGFLGVDVFFVISGYVILSTMMTYDSRSLAEFLLTFYSKRVRRILPALIFFVIICGGVTCLVLPDPSDSLYTGIAALFGFSNVYLFWQSTDYFATNAQYNTLTHTWSLGVEEQFYLVFPLIVYLCIFYRQRANGRFNLITILVALTAASLLYRAEIGTTDPSAAFFLMPARFWELGLGGITYLLVSGYGHQLEGLRVGVLPGILAAVLIMTFWGSPQQSLLISVACVGATSALIAVITRKSITYKALTLGPVLYIGKISYSLYLWHWGSYLSAAGLASIRRTRSPCCWPSCLACRCSRIILSRDHCEGWRGVMHTGRPSSWESTPAAFRRSCSIFGSTRSNRRSIMLRAR